MPTSIPKDVSSLHIAIGPVTSVKLFAGLTALLDLSWAKPSFKVFCFCFLECWACDTKYLCHTPVLASATSHGMYVLDWLIPLWRQKGELKSETWVRSKVHVWNSSRKLLLLVPCSAHFRSQKSEMLKISENSH